MNNSNTTIKENDNNEIIVPTNKEECLLIQLEDKMRDDEPIKDSTKIQFNEKQIRRFSIPYYKEIKNIPIKYFPINKDLMIDMIDIFCEDMNIFPEEIKEAFEIVHTELIKIISIFSECRKSVVINEKTKPFCSDKEENEILIRKHIKINEENKKNFLMRIIPLLNDYISNKYIKNILNEVFINQIHPISEDFLKVCSYYYSYQIVELIRTLKEEVNDYIKIEILKSGIGHFLSELIELTFYVTFKSSENIYEEIDLIDLLH